MAAAAPVTPPAPLPQLPPPFLQTLVKNPNVSAACVAGANAVLQDTRLARQAEFFSGRVTEGLSLILPPVLKKIVLSTDKRVGMGEFLHEAPLWSLGVPDSCGYIGLNYCRIEVIPVFAKWGVCVPSECTSEDIKTAIFPPITQQLADRVKTVCGAMTADKALFFTVEPISAAAWSALMLVLLLVLMALGATVVDAYGREWNPRGFKKDGSWRKILRCFSLSGNYESLMAPPRGGPFASFEAVRTLGMCMILLGHTLFFNLTVVGVTNPRESLGFYGRGFLATVPGLIADGSLLGVDTFLVLAGFLAFFLFLKELGKRLTSPTLSRKGSDAGAAAALSLKGTCTGTSAETGWKLCQMALVSYVRRYLRLTPAYAVMLLIFTTLAPLMSSAPPSPTGIMVEVRQCSEKWWQNLLYINNILSNPYTMCYQASWFLAVVQQLFLLVPWVSALAFWRPKWGLALVMGLCLASYMYTFREAQREGWRINSIDRPGFPKFFADFYASTFTRMPTFLIGGMAAIVWYHWGERMGKFWAIKGGKEGRKVTVQVLVVMGVAMVLFALTMFGPYRELGWAPGSWSQTTSSLYITLSFSGWVMGLVLLCGVLALGRGGWIKKFLELPFWVVPSRLTYSTYLVHPMVILTVIGSDGGQPFHFSMLHVFNAFLGYSTLSAISAVVFFFLVEAPFGEMERLLFSRLPPPSSSSEALVKSKGMEGGEKREQEKNEEAMVVISPEAAGEYRMEERGG